MGGWLRANCLRICVTSLLVMSLCWISLFSTPGQAIAVDFSYASLDTALTRHVREGRVDYGALSRDRGPLSRFILAARDARPDGWSRAERIAFWVNVYNARVLDGVARRPGLKSVLDVGKTVGIPTMGFFREKAVSGSRRISLNDIEHEIIRKGFHEPRLHFVLNCASISCPALPTHPLLAAGLDSTLDAAARSFLLDRTKNELESASGLKLSSIFKWYREDFMAAAGTLQAFVQRQVGSRTSIPANAPIRFLDYDWSINGHW